jgi:hypothetical protein
MKASMVLALFTLVSLCGQAVIAADNVGNPNCCSRCGQHVACAQKTCQVVCDVKKEVKTTWSVEYQDICPLMPGCGDRHEGCPPPPRCGHPKCVKKLVKKESQRDVPIYKCVVRYLCPRCASGGSSAPGPQIAVPANRSDGPATVPPPVAPLPPPPPASPARP